ncbi:hypothetical protein L1277_000744 [Okibacterium sp. HSC-33S16]|uniref:winged helix DNA-binding domain-containing protein n=1 Tax=Okibacterium sp. HSC-33S16 TaxID=2910965 RepID=UPI00209D0E8C|nr:winged helix DNA-binding domain-containing protein [Okibacterium sp. HSC-33S16]MCP2030680.1 hypothetical protein [Okibacterium sp. HSC-33S16]
MARQPGGNDIARLRLRAQHIVSATGSSPVDAVSHMLAMQGQDLPGTLWAIGLRSHATESQVRDAFDSGDLVRSWPMRGTLHALTPHDLRLLLPLSRDRVVSSLAARHRELGIDSNDVAVAEHAAEQALSEAGALSRKDLLAAFERAGQSTAGQRGTHLLFLLAHAGLVCLGPFRGKEQLFVLFERWGPADAPLPDREEALARVALRYFQSHGPATVEDLAWWTKLTLTDARWGTAAVRERLAVFSIGGRKYFASPDTADPSPRAPGARSVVTLPGFDEFILGYTDRSAALAAEHSSLIVPGNNGVFKPTVVIGGRVVGTWTRLDRPRTVEVSAHLFRRLTDAEEHSLARAFDAYVEFRGRPVTLAVSAHPLVTTDTVFAG